MPFLNSSLISDRGNKLLNKELSYDVIALKKLHDKLFNYLNPDQKYVYETIVESIENNTNKLFFY